MIFIKRASDFLSASIITVTIIFLFHRYYHQQEPMKFLFFALSPHFQIRFLLVLVIPAALSVSWLAGRVMLYVTDDLGIPQVPIAYGLTMAGLVILILLAATM